MSVPVLAETQPTPYEEHLTELAVSMGVVETKLAEARERLLAESGVAAENPANSDDVSPAADTIFDGLFGDPEAVEDENAAAVVKRWTVYRGIALSDADRLGVAALAGSRFVEAEEAFTASYEAAQKANNEAGVAFPLFWAGVAALERRADAEAAEWFARAEAYEDNQPAAGLLRRFAENLAAEPAVQRGAIGVAFFDAWLRTEAEVFPDGRPRRRPVFGVPFDPYAETPAVLRAEAEVIDATTVALRERLDRAALLADPEADAITLWAFGDDELRAWATPLLREALPEDHRLTQIFELRDLLRRHDALNGVEQREEQAALWSSIQEWVDRASADDPGNGFWAWLRIEPRDIWARQGGADGDHVEVDAPYTWAEINAVRGAFVADRFEPIGCAWRDVVEQARCDEYGGFARYAENIHAFAAYGFDILRPAVRRATHSMRDIADDGRSEEAGALADGVLAVSERMSVAWGRLIAFLVHRMNEATLDSALVEAAELAEARWVVLAQRREYAVRDALLTQMVDAWYSAALLPVQRVRTIEGDLFALDPAAAEARARAFDRLIAVRGQAIREEARDGLEFCTSEEPEPYDSGFLRRIVELGFVGDTSDLEIIEPYSGADPLAELLLERARERLRAR